MKCSQTTVCFLLLAATPALAADPIYGVWRMRPDPGSQGPAGQVVTVEPSGGGTKFSYDIDLGGGQHLRYEFVTKMDGTPVRATSRGKEIMKIWVRKIRANEYDSGSSGGTTETKFKGIISPDGKTWTTDGVIKTGNNSLPSHVVFDKGK
jgi:hypothetical protein